MQGQAGSNASSAVSTTGSCKRTAYARASCATPLQRRRIPGYDCYRVKSIATARVSPVWTSVKVAVAIICVRGVGIAHTGRPAATAPRRYRQRKQRQQTLPSTRRLKVVRFIRLAARQAHFIVFRCRLHALVTSSQICKRRRVPASPRFNAGSHCLMTSIPGKMVWSAR